MRGSKNPFNLRRSLLSASVKWRKGLRGGGSLKATFFFTDSIKYDYPLNLSILLGGGKENNYDSLSNGE